MSKGYIIEVNRKTVGLVVQTSEPDINYRFLSVVPALNGLEGQLFAGPYEAERAARSALQRPAKRFS